MVWIFETMIFIQLSTIALALILTMRTRDEFLSGIQYSCFAFAAAVSSYPAIMAWIRL
jgi:hypothetical protein